MTIMLNKLPPSNVRGCKYVDYAKWWMLMLSILPQMRLNFLTNVNYLVALPLSFHILTSSFKYYAGNNN